LLRRLRETPEDQASWDEFVGRYRPLLQAWGRHWGLQEADAEDVAQAVLLRLATKIRQFVHDPAHSFRGWLRTLARHAWADFVTDHQKQAREPGDPLRALEEQAAGEDLTNHLAQLFDLELLEEATDRVRDRIEPKTWEAFHRTTVLTESAQMVAQALDMPLASVYKAKSNVRKMLQEEIRLLEKEPVS
jgi:RNA polymerase sigma-70 factor (ECF subfamily)